MVGRRARPITIPLPEDLVERLKGGKIYPKDKIPWALEHFFRDTNLTDTMFRLDEHRSANCVTVHVKGEDGTWTAIGEVLNQSPDYFAGGHGLYGPPSDYIKFQRALLRGGELDGTRILRQETVDAAFTNQIGDLDFPAECPTADPVSSCDFSAGPGFKWGYGLLLNTDDLPGMRRAGSGAAVQTRIWFDRNGLAFASSGC